MQTANTNSQIDTNDELDNERPTETLIHGFTESQHIHDLQDKIVALARAEGQHLLSIFKEKYAEEMKFLTLFYGDLRDDDIT
jgi:hypothetical protein